MSSSADAVLPTAQEGEEEKQENREKMIEREERRWDDYNVGTVFLLCGNKTDLSKNSTQLNVHLL